MSLVSPPRRPRSKGPAAAGPLDRGRRNLFCLFPLPPGSWIMKNKKLSPERRKAIIDKMAASSNISIKLLAKEEGLSDVTLYKIRKEARKEGLILPEEDSGPRGWSSKDKFRVVVETASLNENQLAEYCRAKGLFPEQIAQWKSSCEMANDFDASSNRTLIQDQRKDKQKIHSLEKELRRKERALAETAALLVLQKKVQQFLANEVD